MTSLESVGAALGILKTIAGIAKDVKSLELTQQLIDLQQRILDIQRDVAGFQEENERLRTELRDLKAQQALASSVEYKHGVYWTVDQNRRSGPFCSRCWDADRKLIRLVTIFANERVACPHCKLGVAISWTTNIITD